MAIIGNIKFEKSTRTDQTQRLGKVTSNPRHPLETKFTELPSLQSKDLCHFFFAQCLGRSFVGSRILSGV